MGTRVFAGQRFGRLVVKDHLGKRKWRCKCDCGQVAIVYDANLAAGRTTSCGCLRRVAEPVKDNPLYPIWGSMKNRAKAYGVPVAAEWQSFHGFKNGIGADYFPGARLVRKDRALGFVPGNLEWRAAAG